MTDLTNAQELKRGWTTGACATAAAKAAVMGLWSGDVPGRVTITLPRGETPEFDIAHVARGPGWVECGVIKDAGDDPDVTHGCMVRAHVTRGAHGVSFHAGDGVGVVTLPGLPIPVGQAAVNPVPRDMMTGMVRDLAALHGVDADLRITLSVPGGAEIAAKTWNPRLGIQGGLSILGTTGIVRPFSCAAWIASIHRGVDVARARGVAHVAGCTGATSEATVRALYGLEESAMLDMGDFVGGLVKYIRTHPVPRLTIGGGIGKMTKLAQGAIDLHSGRSQVDFAALAAQFKDPSIAEMRTALQVYDHVGDELPKAVATQACVTLRHMLRDAPVCVDVVVIDRAGAIIGRAS